MHFWYLPTEDSFRPSTDKTEGKGEIDYCLLQIFFFIFFVYVEGGLEMEIPLVSQEIQMSWNPLKWQGRQENLIPSVTQENLLFISRVTSQQIKKWKIKEN